MIATSKLDCRQPLCDFLAHCLAQKEHVEAVDKATSKFYF